MTNPLNQFNQMYSSSVVKEGIYVRLINHTFSHNLHYHICTTSIDEEEEILDIELDSHMNSPVVGKYILILRHTVNQFQMSRFTNKLGDSIDVDVSDTEVCYD